MGLPWLVVLLGFFLPRSLLQAVAGAFCLPSLPLGRAVVRRGLYLLQNSFVAVAGLKFGPRFAAAFCVPVRSVSKIAISVHQLQEGLLYAAGLDDFQRSSDPVFFHFRFLQAWGLSWLFLSARLHGWAVLFWF